MGLRVDSDIDWKMFGCEDYKLSADGFCNKCDEFHSDCFCEAFWVRKAAAQHKTIHKLIEGKRRFKKIYDELESAAVCAATAPASEVLQNILRILFKGEHRDYQLK
jgi:hypothetical protein